jgi:predicted TIM-barrel fold metal-dependent hydrolase
VIGDPSHEGGTPVEFTRYSPEMTYTELPYEVFDCDFHFYETADSFTRYLPGEYQGLVRLATVDGRTKMIVRGRISDYIPNPTFEVAAEPGSGFEYFSGKNTEGRTYREIVRPMRAIPAFTDPDARLALMDRMHIHSTLNFPTLASIIEVNFMDDPIASQVLIHAFNQWMYDEWGFDHVGRIFTTPVMNLATAEGAVKELEWALERGAKTVLVRPAPVAGFKGPQSPFLPYADPFWRLVEEANIPVMLHSSDSGYTRYTNDWNGSDQEMRPFESNVFSDLSMSQRPIEDTIYSAVGHGMLSRFPGVRIASIECGSAWLKRAVEKFKVTYGKMPQLFAEHPLDVLNRALYIAPYWEDSLEPLIETIGVDHILFNSDWPHPEGIADPNEFGLYARDEVGVPEADVAKIMGGNMRQLLGVAA